MKCDYDPDCSEVPNKHNWWWDCDKTETGERGSLYWEAIDTLWPNERKGSFDGPEKEVEIGVGVDLDDYCIVEALIAERIILQTKLPKPKKIKVTKEIDI